MESPKITEHFSELTDDVRRYVRLRISMLKLLLTEKLSGLFSFIVITMIFFIIFLFVVLFLSLAFIYWFRIHVGPAYWGAMIVAGFYILLAIIIYLLRVRLFVNPVVRQLSQILLEEEQEDE
jgi:hypothetical protein